MTLYRLWCNYIELYWQKIVLLTKWGIIQYLNRLDMIIIYNYILRWWKLSKKQLCKSKINAIISLGNKNGCAARVDRDGITRGPWNWRPVSSIYHNWWRQRIDCPDRSRDPGKTGKEEGQWEVILNITAQPKNQHTTNPMVCEWIAMGPQ